MRNSTSKMFTGELQAVDVANEMPGVYQLHLLCFFQELYSWESIHVCYEKNHLKKPRI